MGILNWNSVFKGLFLSLLIYGLFGITSEAGAQVLSQSDDTKTIIPEKTPESFSLTPVDPRPESGGVKESTSDLLVTLVNESTRLSTNSDGSQRGHFTITYRVRNISQSGVSIAGGCAATSYESGGVSVAISPPNDLKRGSQSCDFLAKSQPTLSGGQSYYIAPNNSQDFSVVISGDAQVSNDFRGHITSLNYNNTKRHNVSNVRTRELALRGPSGGEIDLNIDEDIWFTGERYRISWDNTRYPDSKIASFYLGRGDYYWSSCQLDEIDNTPLSRNSIFLNLGKEVEECFGGGAQNDLRWSSFGDVYQLIMVVDNEKVAQKPVLVINEDSSSGGGTTLGIPNIERVDILANQPLWENRKTEKYISWTYQNIPTDKKFRVGLYSTDGLNTWGNRKVVPVERNSGTQVVKLSPQTNTSWYDRDIHMRVRVYNADGTEWRPNGGRVAARSSEDYYGQFQIVEKLPEDLEPITGEARITRITAPGNGARLENRGRGFVTRWTYENVPMDKEFKVGFYSTDGYWANAKMIKPTNTRGTQQILLVPDTNASWYDRDIYIRVRIYNDDGTEYRPEGSRVEGRSGSLFKIVPPSSQSTSGIQGWFSGLGDFMASQLAGLFAIFR